MPTPTLTGTPVVSVYSNPIVVTAGSGSNIYGAFGVRTTQPSVPPAAVTATWGADAMTMYPQGTNNVRTSTIGLRSSPATGAQNVTATSTDVIRGLIGASFQDVVSIGANAQNNGSSSSPSVNAGTIGANDALLVHLVWENSVVTLDTPGGTLIASTSEDNHRSAMVLASSGSWSGTFSGSVGWAVSSVVLEGAAAGPTIDTQPQADTVLINGDPTRASASFTVAATGTGTLTYQWQLETSVGGGVYAGVANGSGATWSGATTTNLTATFTVKTLTGRRVRCNVTDSNGTTTTNAVVLTVYTGPVISKASGTTNGSGVDTLTITSDYPNADGEFTVVTATAGGITKQVALHYEP